MKARWCYLLKTYVVMVLLFIVAKVVFMVVCHEATPVLTIADVWQVVRHGLSLDLSTALYFFIVPFLLTGLSVWVRVPRWLLKVYYAVVALAFALAFVADTSLYTFWHFKLDASCLGYLANPADAVASVTTGYLLIRLAALMVVALVIYLLLSRNKKKTSRSSFSRSGHFTRPTSLTQKILETAFYLLLVPLIVIGIRGGLGESTTNIGQVYFSQNQFLNHSAVNPVFSFLSSLSKSGDYIVSYDYYDDAELQQLTDNLFFTDSDGADTLLTTPRPNVLIIIMESAGAQFTAVGGRPDVMPRLDRLSAEGVSFSECYANSWRTDKGVVSVLSGYPAFPVTSVMKIPEKSRKLPSIAASLSREGYATSFFYGGDINFTNMRSYVMGTGYDRLRWKADYPADAQRSAKWGVRDDLMLSSLFDDIRQEQSPRWMKTLLTLSSHEPWDVPTQQLDDPVYNAFNYLDQCLGTFIDSLRQTPAWQDLLVVILPDHGYRYKGIDETTRLYNHIPMIWLGGAVRRPCRIDRVCSQSDLAATLLGQLQLRHDDFTFSRDVLSDRYQQPFAYHTFNNGFTVIDSTGFAAYDLDVQTVIAHDGPDAERLLRQGRALLQLTSHDLKDK